MQQFYLIGLFGICLISLGLHILLFNMIEKLIKEVNYLKNRLRFWE